MFRIHPETPDHGPAIERLHHLAFGPGRYAKTAYRFREDVAPVSDLAAVGFEELAVEDREVLRGSVRYWPIRVVGADGAVTPALLLGPLAIDPRHRNKGFGLALMRHTLDLAAQAGHGLVILVGDPPYYAKVGFRPVPKGRLTFPAPVDPARLLYRDLAPGAFDKVTGTVRPARR